MSEILSQFQPREILGVQYFHTQTPDGGDLYLTQYGLPFAQHLLPENWREREWYLAHRQKLRGTSTIYRTPTRPVDGKSLDIVVRYNRVGEELPVDTLTLHQFLNAEFNSPFEEIAVLADLRAARLGPERRRIPTKKPLAIFEPPDLLQLWQSGRLESKMAMKLARYPQAMLDIRRQYILLYGWIEGYDAQQVADKYGLVDAEREQFLKETTAFVTDELATAGFRVLDMKPAHVILRLDEGGNLKHRQDGQLLYALVDYELLEKIPPSA
ncbi:MAG TPA: hypothetical protein VF988_10110 [Verrucomicrobiae bacterium]